MVAVPHTNIAVTPANGPRLSQSRALNYVRARSNDHEQHENCPGACCR